MQYGFPSLPRKTAGVSDSIVIGVLCDWGASGKDLGLRAFSIFSSSMKGYVTHDSIKLAQARTSFS